VTPHKALPTERKTGRGGKAAVLLPATAGRAIAFVLRPGRRAAIASATRLSSDADSPHARTPWGG
jgi:hypothetical protein